MIHARVMMNCIGRYSDIGFYNAKPSTCVPHKSTIANLCTSQTAVSRSPKSIQGLAGNTVAEPYVASARILSVSDG